MTFVHPGPVLKPKTLSSKCMVGTLTPPTVRTACKASYIAPKFDNLKAYKSQKSRTFSCGLIGVNAPPYFYVQLSFSDPHAWICETTVQPTVLYSTLTYKAHLMYRHVSVTLWHPTCSTARNLHENNRHEPVARWKQWGRRKLLLSFPRYYFLFPAWKFKMRVG